MTNSPSEEDYINNLQPSPQELASLLFDLRSYNIFAIYNNESKPPNERLLKALDKYVYQKPGNDQWVFYVDFPRRPTTPIPPTNKISMQTYYGGREKRIFNPNLEPYRSILAAGLQSKWEKVAAARFAMDAQGDVQVFFDRIGADLHDRAARSNDGASVLFESVTPILKRSKDVGKIDLVANEDVQ